MKSPDRNTLKKLLKNAGAVLFWIALWQFAAMLVSEELILPAPWAVMVPSALVAAGASTVL